MRYVYPTVEIAHLFAAQSQEEARNPGKNFYFTGQTLFSYGPHYPVARLFPRKKPLDDTPAGRYVAVINAARYSVTTAKHQFLARNALMHYTRFEVKGAPATPEACVAALVESAHRCAVDALAPRIKPDTKRAREQSANARYQTARALAEATGVKMPRARYPLAAPAALLVERMNKAVDEYNRAVAFIDRQHAAPAARDAELRTLPRLAKDVAHWAKLARRKPPKLTPPVTTRAELNSMIAANERKNAERRWAEAASYPTPAPALGALNRMTAAAQQLHAGDTEAQREARQKQIDAAREELRAEYATSLLDCVAKMLERDDIHNANSRINQAEMLGVAPEIISTARTWFDAYKSKRAEILAARHAQARADWREHKGERALYHNGPIMLRLSKDGRHIETSHGATVPARVVKRAWSMIEAQRALQKEMRFGHVENLGVHPWRMIHANGDIQVGCHYLTYDEMKPIALTLLNTEATA